MFTLINKFWQFYLNLFTRFIPKEPEKKSSTSNPIIELSPEDFAIVFRDSKLEAVVPLLEDSGDSDEEIAAKREYIDNTISYVVHCLLREDWQEEFFDAVDEYLEKASEIEAEERRAKFKLIVNNEVEDNDESC